MKIITWNVRGLGRVEKRKEVMSLVMEKGPSILCLQETKLYVCDEALCASLCGRYTSFLFIPSFSGGFQWFIVIVGYYCCGGLVDCRCRACSNDTWTVCSI